MFPADRRSLIFPLTAKAVEGYRTPRREALSGAQWFPPAGLGCASPLALFWIGDPHFAPFERHHTPLQEGVGRLWLIKGAQGAAQAQPIEPRKNADDIGGVFGYKGAGDVVGMWTSFS